MEPTLKNGFISYLANQYMNSKIQEARSVITEFLKFEVPDEIKLEVLFYQALWEFKKDHDSKIPLRTIQRALKFIKETDSAAIGMRAANAILGFNSSPDVKTEILFLLALVQFKQSKDPISATQILELAKDQQGLSQKSEELIEGSLLNIEIATLEKPILNKLKEHISDQEKIQLYLQLGNLKLRIKKFDEAIQIYKMANEAIPPNDPSWKEQIADAIKNAECLKSSSK